MECTRLLAVAAASRRIGYVFFVGTRLVTWRISERAAASPIDASGALQGWINDLRPHIVATEKLGEADPKGMRTRAILEALASTTANNYLLDVSVRPKRFCDTKAEEAARLVSQYPELASWKLKKRRAFDSAHRNTVLFDALSVANAVLAEQPDIYASALDH